MQNPALALALAPVLAYGCAARGYEGPLRSSAEVAHIASGPKLFALEKLDDRDVYVLDVDGRRLPSDTCSVDVEPGTRDLEVWVFGSALRRTLRFETVAGADYRILFAKSEIDLDGKLTVTREDDGRVVLTTEPSVDEVRTLELPALARGWSVARWYRDDTNAPEDGVWSVAYVPSEEAGARWTRRLELQLYRTKAANPPLDAVAIDLERCLRTRFSDVRWEWGELGEHGRVDRWRATGGAGGASLEAVTLLRPRLGFGVEVASYAVRDRALEADEARAWTEALLATSSLEVEEVR